MFNLIRKDIILLKTTLMILLPALFVYLTLGSSSIWVGVLFSIAIIMSAFAVDEKSSSNTLLNSLPYTRKEIVSSKYIGAFIFTFLVVFTIFIGNLIVHREITVWKDLLFIISLVMVSTSLFLPFSYKFKSQYLLIGNLVLFAFYMVIQNYVVQNLNDKIKDFMHTLLALENVQFYLIVVFSVITLYVCSWLLSIRIYSKKVF